MDLVKEQTMQWTNLMNTQRKTVWELKKTQLTAQVN